MTRKPAGSLHPLPVPDGHGQAIAIDFIGPLPLDDGFNCIATISDRLGADFRPIPTRTDITAEDFAALFFKHWYCENGLPLDIVSDRDKLFVSQFWKALNKLTGVKLKMSTSFHPETDGSSERFNKTVIQSLRFHVEQNQTGWSRALPLIHFNYMNTVNASTGHTPFQLHLGRAPRVIPPLFNASTSSTATEIGLAAVDAARLLETIETDVMEAQDNLLLAKTNQAAHVDHHCGPEIVYKTGDKVLLSTFHHHREYMQRGDHRVAKFMLRYDGPYTVLQSWPASSVYTLDMPNSEVVPTFHSSLLRPWVPNDNELFPSRAHSLPDPIVTADGEKEWQVQRILERRRHGRGFQYLVEWTGYGEEHNLWLPGSEVKDLAVLDEFLARNNLNA